MKKTGNPRILFVEDEGVIAPFYIQELKLAGYDVEFYQGVDLSLIHISEPTRPY